MRRVVKLENGIKAEVYWAWLDNRRTVTEVVLWHDGLRLGTLVWRGPGKYELMHLANPRYAKFDDEVIDYYLAKYPDLVGEEPKSIFEKGFAREVDISSLLERFEEMFRAMSLTSEDTQHLFLVVDAEGRIYTWDESAAAACNRAMAKGWEGWFSLDRAGENTLRVVPAGKARVHVQGG